jgi:luciferase family oxidoreductase group 1
VPVALCFAMRLSLLDRSRTRRGYSEAAALWHSVERAVRAEKLGYRRFWAAEHHAVPGVASGSPAVLLAAAGAATQEIRLGSGGVMLPHHQPLVVAEQFLMLAGLYPGRIDLGLGRSLGFTEPVRRALRQQSAEEDEYAADLAELGAYLHGTAEVTAQPVVPPEDRPVMHVLATGKGIGLAAQLGLSVVLGGPVLRSVELPEMLRTYRRDFRPAGEGGTGPEVIVSADVYPAPTRGEARSAALPEAWAMARSRETGVFAALEPVERIQDAQWSSRTRERVEQSLTTSILGTPLEVSDQIERLMKATGAGEFMISTSTYDLEELGALDAEVSRILLGRGDGGAPEAACSGGCGVGSI